VAGSSFQVPCKDLQYLALPNILLVGQHQVDYSTKVQLLHKDSRLAIVLLWHHSKCVSQAEPGW